MKIGYNLRSLLDPGKRAAACLQATAPKLTWRLFAAAGPYSASMTLTAVLPLR